MRAAVRAADVGVRAARLRLDTLKTAQAEDEQASRRAEAEEAAAERARLATEERAARAAASTSEDAESGRASAGGSLGRDSSSRTFRSSGKSSYRRSSGRGGGRVHVGPYTRKDGTRVRGHTRSR